MKYSSADEILADVLLIVTQINLYAVALSADPIVTGPAKVALTVAVPNSVPS